MKRITPLAEALENGRADIDADGIQISIGAPYDSGVRDVSPLLANGWTGKAYLWRTGSSVTLRLDTLDATNATSGAFITLPAGFSPRPVKAESFHARFGLHTAAGTFRRGAVNNSTPTVYGYGPTEVLFGEIHLTTTDPVPTDLPGT